MEDILQRYYTKEKFKLLLKDKGFFLSAINKQSDPDDGKNHREEDEEYIKEGLGDTNFSESELIDIIIKSA